jgi:hypothetical protein
MSFACELILLLYCASHQLQNVHKFVSILTITEQLTVPTTKAIVTAITVIVLCVPPVRIVYICQYRLTITEQLTVPTSKTIVTATHADDFVSTCMVSLQWQPAVPDTTHVAKVRKLQVQTNCSVHNLDAALCLRPTNPLFYLTTIGPSLLFAPSPYYRSHSLPAAHICGRVAAENDKRYLSGKMWMQSVHDPWIGVGITALFVHC